ncbi:4-hydroxy-tetrahydrodipicolinate reductase [Candidatus Woesearchaeota archaeon]|nr:4-hydroxy-tetrahydrodipicolinate reductase [Candidatus Woesearchaeota archaeon]
MNIAIVGYGRMGHEIEKIAKAKGIDVVSIIDPNASDATHREINEDSMQDVDVCIDFTTPNSVIDSIQKISKFRKNIVVGTTGWYDKLEEARKIVNQSNIGLIYASNFSIGVNVFFKIVENAAKIINNIEDYDVYGYELHHNKKIDSPSGTAKTLAEILIKNIKRKSKLEYGKIDRKIEPDELHFASVRAGSIPGTHIVGFDSSADTIELKHVARNREGFALGAVMAAQWINGKKGFYDINDMMKSIIGGE